MSVRVYMCVIERVGVRACGCVWVRERVGVRASVTESNGSLLKIDIDESCRPPTHDFSTTNFLFDFLFLSLSSSHVYTRTHSLTHMHAHARTFSILASTVDEPSFTD